MSGKSKPKKDLTGMRFGRWTVIEYKGAVFSGRSTTYWRCVCDCGSERSVNSQSLIKGTSRSCGCLHNEEFSKRLTKHGYSNHPLRTTYRAMKNRCNNPRNMSYANYGGRGIRICPEWEQNYTSFVRWALDNGWQKGLTIDRMDVNKGYSPDNCRWVTKAEQNRNMRKLKKYTHNGENKLLSDWCRDLNLDYERTRSRLRLGWSFEDAISLPLRAHATDR